MNERKKKHYKIKLRKIEDSKWFICICNAALGYMLLTSRLSSSLHSAQQSTIECSKIAHSGYLPCITFIELHRQNDDVICRLLRFQNEFAIT